MKVNTAVILAGGKSKRMGRDKWSLPWKDSTLLEDLYWELAKAFNRVLVSTRTQLDIPFQQIVDVVDAGSMGGIYSSLVYIGEPAFFVAVDMPFFNKDVARIIADMYEDRFDMVIPYVQGKFQPLAAVYAPSVVENFRQKILMGEFKIISILDEIEKLILDEDFFTKNEIPLSVFTNINTPGEYERVRKRI